MLVFLIGYMGCGKSTIGRKLSQRLSLPLVDTDKVIEQREGMAIVDIFAKSGERAFRDMERALLVELIESGESTIVSTGGGLPMWFDNMELMNFSGAVVFLSRSVDNIISRLSQRGREKRPKIRGLNDAELKEFMDNDLAGRLPFYNKASIVLDVEHMCDDEIMDTISSRCSNGL